MTEIKRFWKKVYCKSCDNNTHHGILKKHSIGEEYDNGAFFWQEDYIIGTCLGCDKLNFIKVYDDSSMHFYHYEEEEHIDLEDIQVFPSKPVTSKSNKHEIVEFHHLPEVLDTLYKQVVANFELKYYLLAAAGYRMLIEGICNEQSIKNGYVTDDNTGEIILDEDNNQVRSSSLNGKINGLVEKGWLTEGQVKILHMIRKIGNQTVHKLDNPSKKVMKDGLEIIEHTLKNIYELKKYERIKSS